LGNYADYLNNLRTADQVNTERQKILKKISELRDKRDILVIASDLSKSKAPISIDYTDILPVQDQLSNLHGKSIDIILETPGGFAEVVEDIVDLVRKKYESVGMIIPGWAKSAGTIFAMAGDEILMGSNSALGPVDAQISVSGKNFSADAFLEGLDKIVRSIEKHGKLNPAYIPILQNISPGEIQNCENVQNFSKELVTRWLENYKFKYWDLHSDKVPVTNEERHARAKEIAEALCSQSKWLTHGRSIKIDDLQNLKVKITDYGDNPDLNDAITKYYTLLRMTFERTSLYKLFETPTSTIFRFVGAQTVEPKEAQTANVDFECPNCHNKFKIQANLDRNMEIQPGSIPYPIRDDIFICPKCKTESNLSAIRLNIEAQTGKRVV
jgi:Serine dehydrogenase proteinase